MNYISVKEVLSEVLENPLLNDVTLSKAVRHAVDFIRMMGDKHLFEHNEVTLNVEDYKTELPCDLYQIEQVRFNRCGEMIYLKPSTSTFDDKCNELIYYKRGNYLHFGFETGSIELAYLSMKMDDDGYPMIPDNVNYKNALRLYIQRYYYGFLFDQGKINANVMQRIDTMATYAIKCAKGDLSLPTLEEAENIGNMVRQVIDVDHNKSGYKNLNDEINLRLQ